MEDGPSPFWKKVLGFGAILTGFAHWPYYPIDPNPPPETLPFLVVYVARTIFWIDMGLLFLRSAFRWPMWIQTLLYCIGVAAFVATIIAQMGLWFSWW